MPQKTVLALLTILISVAISTGCGSDTNNSADKTPNNDSGFDLDNTTPIPLDKFKAQSNKLTFELMCDGIFNCPEKHPISFIRNAGRFADKADCVANLPLQFGGGEGGLSFVQTDAIEAGRLEYDPD